MEREREREREKRGRREKIKEAVDKEKCEHYRWPSGAKIKVSYKSPFMGSFVRVLEVRIFQKQYP